MKREQRKAKAIKALSAANTITEAAEVAGVTRRTLYNYMHDPWFIKELEKEYNAVLIEQVFDLEEQRRKAEDMLTELLDDPSPSVRLRAVKIALDNARKRENAMLGIYLRQHEIEKDDPLGFYSTFHTLNQ